MSVRSRIAKCRKTGEMFVWPDGSAWIPAKPLGVGRKQAYRRAHSKMMRRAVARSKSAPAGSIHRWICRECTPWRGSGIHLGRGVLADLMAQEARDARP